MPRTNKTEVKLKKSLTILSGAKAVSPKKSETIVKSTDDSKKSTKQVTEVFDLEAKIVEKISLPEKIFFAKINKPLIAQAVRVYRANQRQGNASTKTRGEVEGSTRKIYRQKGTGRARHGSIRAPIFVHGGIVGGPKPRDYSLRLSQKMKRSALFSALTDKLKRNEIKVLHGLEKIEPKTKSFVKVISKLELNVKTKKILLVTASEIENLKRAVRNIEGVTITTVKRLNTYDILNNHQLLFMKEAVAELKKHFLDKTK